MNAGSGSPGAEAGSGGDSSMHRHRVGGHAHGYEPLGLSLELDQALQDDGFPITLDQHDALSIMLSSK